MLVTHHSGVEFSNVKKTLRDEFKQNRK